MIASNKTLDALRGIGLNLYERKLWVALLARGTSTAGELSEIASVPRSRAYDILQSLADKGFAVVQTSKPIRYVAVAPEEALDRARKKLEEDIKTMNERIEDLKGSPVMRELNDVFSKGLKVVAPEDITGSLKGKYSVYQQLDSMFKNASSKINIVTTSEGLNELHQNHFESLKKAKDKGVAIRIAGISNEKSQDAVKALNSLAEIRHIDEKEVGILGKFFVVDGKEIVMGLSDPKNSHATQDVAFWSKSEHAAGKVLEPVFKLVWNNSKPVG